jgi:O-antigen/teichoic acid export membrane protein
MIGIVVGVLVSILNTRNLAPAEYGDVRYVNNLISFFSGLLLFGYFISGSRLLALSQSEQETREIKGLLVTILMITNVILMVIIFICGLIHQFFLAKEFYYLFYLTLPVCGGVALLLNYVNTSSQGDNSIYTIACARLLPSLTYLVIASIIYYQFGATRERMLLLNNSILFIVLAIIIYLNKPSFKNLKKTFKKLNEENKKYGLQVYYGSLANVSVAYIAGITLGLLNKDNTNVGFYTLALTISGPLHMLPQVIGTTYYKQFASQNSIPSKVLRYSLFLAVITYIAYVVMIYPVVGILYDKSYGVVALYASFLAIGSTLLGLGDIFNRFLGAHGQGSYLRNTAFISGGVQIIGFTLGVYLWNINGAIITRILSSLVYFAFMVIYYIHFTKTSINSNGISI